MYNDYWRIMITIRNNLFNCAGKQVEDTFAYIEISQFMCNYSEGTNNVQL